MTVRIRTTNGTTVEVPENITLAALKRRLAEPGDSNPSELQIDWSGNENGERVWGAPWPEADFSGNVTL